MATLLHDVDARRRLRGMFGSGCNPDYVINTFVVVAGDAARRTSDVVIRSAERAVSG